MDLRLVCHSYIQYCMIQRVSILLNSRKQKKYEWIFMIFQKFSSIFSPTFLNLIPTFLNFWRLLSSLLQLKSSGKDEDQASNLTLHCNSNCDYTSSLPKSWITCILPWKNCPDLLVQLASVHLDCKAGPCSPTPSGFKERKSCLCYR